MNLLHHNNTYKPENTKRIMIGKELLECYLLNGSPLTITLYHPDSRRVIERKDDWGYVRAETLQKPLAGKDFFHESYQKNGEKVMVPLVYFNSLFDMCVARQTLESLMEKNILEEAKRVFPQK